MKKNYKQINLTNMNKPTKKLVARTDQKIYIDVNVSDDEQDKIRKVILGTNKKSNYINKKYEN